MGPGDSPGWAIHTPSWTSDRPTASRCSAVGFVTPPHHAAAGGPSEVDDRTAFGPFGAHRADWRRHVQATRWVLSASSGAAQRCCWPACSGSGAQRCCGAAVLQRLHKRAATKVGAGKKKRNCLRPLYLSRALFPCMCAPTNKSVIISTDTRLLLLPSFKE